jgi:hypothetical protein
LELYVIDETVLQDVVRRVVGCPGVRVQSWNAELIEHLRINLLTTGLFRVAGEAIADGGNRVAWSVILKIVALKPADPSSPFNASDDSSHWNYWRREPLAYQSSWLRQKDCALRLPRCWHAEDSGAGEIRMWLEEIVGVPAPQWPLERYALAARHLAQHQGAYLCQGKLPDEAWLVRNYFHARFRRPPLEELCDAAVWRDSLVAEFFPEPFGDTLVQLWNARELLLDRIARSPQTVCHMDVWPPNMIACRSWHGEDETALIDWSGVGIGALGQDLGNLVPDSASRFFVSGRDLPRMEELVLGGYIEGMRDCGWKGKASDLRQTYDASLALSWGFYGHWSVLSAVRQEDQGRLEARFNLPLREILRRRAPMVAYILGVVRRALAETAV